MKKVIGISVLLVLICVFSVGLCVIAALYPARRAAAVLPARAVNLET